MSNKFFDDEDDIIQSIKDLPLNEQMRTIANYFSPIDDDSIPKVKRLTSEDVFKALSQKRTVYDIENDRIIALLEDGVFAIDDMIQNVMAQTVGSYFMVIEDDYYKQDKFDFDRIGELLVTLEYINASGINNQAFQNVKHKAATFLREEFTKDEDKNVLLQVQLLKFMSRTKANIPTQEIKSGSFRADVSIEKESFRQLYIGELFNEGVMDLEFLKDSGFIDELNVEDVDFFFRNNPRVSSEEFIDLVSYVGNFDSRMELLNYYNKKDTYKYLVNTLATKEDIARLVLAGDIDAKELKRVIPQDFVKFDDELVIDILSTKYHPGVAKTLGFLELKSNEDGQKEYFISKNCLKHLDREKLLLILNTDTLAYKSSLTSEELVKMYGKLNSDDIIDLQEKGLIEDEDVIKLLDFNSMKTIDNEEYNKMLVIVAAFYDVQRIESLIENDKLNKDFVEKINRLIDELPKEQKEEYIKLLGKGFDESKESFITMIKKGFKIPENMKINFTSDELQDLFLDEKMTEEDVISLYKSKVIGKDLLSSMFSDREILSLYKKGTVEFSALTALTNREDLLKEEFSKKKMSIDQIISLYAQTEDFSTDELEEIFKGYDISDVQFAEFLPDDISKEKIEELFLGFFISHDDISNLVARKMITEEQAQEYTSKLSSHEEYEKMFSSPTANVILTQDTEKGESRTQGLSMGSYGTSTRSRSIKIDPELKEEFMQEIGFDSRRLYLNGTENSLDGYEVYPSEELGLMVFINKEKPGNAGYVMSLAQGMYWLKRIDRSRLAETSIIESSATKQELRETEHVKVRNDCKAWGKNMLDSMKQLSPVLRDKLHDDKDYKKSIDAIIDEIREDYELRK